MVDPPAKKDPRRKLSSKPRNEDQETWVDSGDLGVTVVLVPSYLPMRFYYSNRHQDGRLQPEDLLTYSAAGLRTGCLIRDRKGDLPGS